MTIAVDMGRKATKTNKQILLGKRDLVALLRLSSWCLVMVMWLFLAVPWVCLQFVIVVFPDHTHLLFLFSNSAKTHYDDNLGDIKQRLHDNTVPSLDTTIFSLNDNPRRIGAFYLQSKAESRTWV